MNINVGIASEDHSLELERALLLYRYGESQEECFVTVNEVKDGKIKQGVPINNTLLDEFIRALRSGEQKTIHTQFIPANVIANSPMSLIWHVPEHCAKIWFRSGKKEAGANGKKVVWPHLLFVAERNNLSVFALRSKGRPTENTKLYRPPFWNVYKSCRICMPSRSMPGLELSDIEKWDKLFFESNFSHQAHDIKKLTKYAGGHAALWNDNANQQWKHFPGMTLIPLTLTLGEFIAGKQVKE